MGRTQATLFFWGLVSLCFATAACFYFWKNAENESKANRLRDEVLNLQSTCDTLAAEKQRLQTGNADEDSQLKMRESLLQQKETQLDAEEAHLNALSQKPPAPAPETNSPQAVELKKFGDALRVLAPAGESEVIARGSGQVLRINSTLFFDAGDATLQPGGKTLLNQITQALKGQTTGVELRLECFTDSEAEAKADAKSHASAPWDLTFARAAALNRFFRDQAALPPSLLLIVARGDSQPIAGKEAPTQNRRVEISLTAAPDASFDPLAPPPDAPAPAPTAK